MKLPTSLTLLALVAGAASAKEGAFKKKGISKRLDKTGAGSIRRLKDGKGGGKGKGKGGDCLTLKYEFDFETGYDSLTGVGGVLLDATPNCETDWGSVVDGYITYEEVDVESLGNNEVRNEYCIDPDEVSDSDDLGILICVDPAEGDVSDVLNKAKIEIDGAKFYTKDDSLDTSGSCCLFYKDGNDIAVECEDSLPVCPVLECPAGETLHEVSYSYDTTAWANNVNSAIEPGRGTLNIKLEAGATDIKFDFAVRHSGVGSGDHSLCIPNGSGRLTVVDTDENTINPNWNNYGFTSLEYTVGGVTVLSKQADGQIAIEDTNQGSGLINPARLYCRITDFEWDDSGTAAFTGASGESGFAFFCGNHPASLDV